MRFLPFVITAASLCFGEFLETDSILGNSNRLQLNDSVVLKVAPPTSSPDSILCTESGSNKIRKAVYPDSLPFADSTRACHVADTALNTPDSVRASYVSDTSIVSSFSDSSSVSGLSDSTKANAPHGVDSGHIPVSMGNNQWGNSAVTDTGDTFIVREDVAIDSCIYLQSTISNKLGVIYKGGLSFLHNFHHPTGGGAIPDGYNTFIGDLAGNFTSGSTATLTDHASYNVGIGYASLSNNSTGYDNLSIGAYAMFSNTTGFQCCAIGRRSLQVNTTGTYNSGFGAYSLYLGNGTGNTGGGAYALSGNTSGDLNSVLGYRSLSSMTTGTGNSAIGANAGRYTNAAANNTSATNSTFLGYDTRVNAVGETNQIVIGYAGRGLGSNTTVIGNSSTVSTTLKGNLHLDADDVYAKFGGSHDAWIGYESDGNFHFYSQAVGSGNFYFDDGSMYLGSVPDAGSASDSFLVLKNNLISKRTAANVLDDIGGQDTLSRLDYPYCFTYVDPAYGLTGDLFFKARNAAWNIDFKGDDFSLRPDNTYDGRLVFDLYSGARTVYTMRNVGGELQISYTDTADARDGGGTTNDTVMVVLEKGEIGIGTTNPACQLHAVSTGNTEIRTETTTSTAYSILGLGTSAASRAGYLICYSPSHASDPNKLALKNLYGQISFYTGTGGSTTNRLEIANDGGLFAYSLATDNGTDLVINASNEICKKANHDTSFAVYCSLYEDATYKTRQLCYFLVNYEDSTIRISGPQIAAAVGTGVLRIRNPNVKATRTAATGIPCMVYDDSNQELGVVYPYAGYIQLSGLTLSATDGIDNFDIEYRF